MLAVTYRMTSISICALALAACGGGGGSGGGSPPPPPPSSYTIGGTVSGLAGTGLVLQNVGGNPLSVTANGSFTFSSAVVSGGGYSVSVQTHPSSPSQSCSVTNGSGTVTTAAVTTVNVTCTTQVARFLYSANTGSNNVGAYAINAATGALTQVAGSPYPANVAPLFISANRAGTSLYVASEGAVNTPARVSAYSINGTTGALTEVTNSPFELSTPTPVTGPSTVAKPIVHPTGASVYLGIRGSGLLYGATVNSTSGTLTEIPNMQSVGLGQQFGAFDVAGKVLYVPNDNFNGTAAGAISAYTAATPSGALTPLGSFATGGRSPGGITLNPAGTFLLSANNTTGTVSVFAVDAASGALTAAANSPFSTGAGTTPTSVSIHRNGKFVYVSSTNATPALSVTAAFQLDAATGTLTAIAGSPFSTGGTHAAVGTVDPTGKFFFVSNSGSDNIQAFTIDQATGALTVVPGSPFATEDEPAPLVIDPSGKYLYSVNTDANSISSYSINPTTGALTLVNTVAAGVAPRFPELVGLQ